MEVPEQQAERDNFKPKVAKIPGIGDYMNVSERVRWFRRENPAGCIQVEQVIVDFASGYAVVKAIASAPGLGVTENFGSATREVLLASALDRFKNSKLPNDVIQMKAAATAADFVEFATTSAIGRALANLGYGTDAALDELLNKFADAPRQSEASEQPARPRLVAVPSGPAQAAPQGERPTPGPGVATDKQVKAAYWMGRSIRKMNEAAVTAWSLTMFGCPPEELSKAEASQLIDAIKDESVSPPPAPEQPAPARQRPTAAPVGPPRNISPEAKEWREQLVGVLTGYELTNEQIRDFVNKALDGKKNEDRDANDYKRLHAFATWLGEQGRALGALDDMAGWKNSYNGSLPLNFNEEPTEL